MTLGDILLSLAISLLATLIIEEIIALIWKCSLKDQLIIALSNCVTNPIVVFAFIVLVLYLNANRILVSCVLELSATAAEAFLFRKISDIKRPVLFSVTANAVSYFLGLTVSLFLRG